MKVTARYPIKIGSVMIPAGTTGSIVAITDRIRSTFPNLRHAADSPYLLVKFPGVLECLVTKAQATKIG